MFGDRNKKKVTAFYHTIYRKKKTGTGFYHTFDRNKENATGFYYTVDRNKKEGIGFYHTVALVPHSSKGTLMVIKSVVFSFTMPHVPL